MLLSIYQVYFVFVLAVLCIPSIEAAHVLPGCLILQCETSKIPFSTFRRVRACDECQNKAAQSKFCLNFATNIYCLDSVPQQCSKLSNTVSQQPTNFTKLCYVPGKVFLPIVVVNQSSALTLTVPPFFDDDQYKHLEFDSLYLSILFVLSKDKKCASGPFTTKPTPNPNECLWMVPMSIPVIDAPEAKNDPFYYDDRTDVSLSISPHIFSVKENSKISVWYSVNANYVIGHHNNQQLKFTIPMYSYRKDVLLKLGK